MIKAAGAQVEQELAGQDLSKKHHRYISRTVKTNETSAFHSLDTTPYLFH